MTQRRIRLMHRLLDSNRWLAIAAGALLSSCSSSGSGTAEEGQTSLSLTAAVSDDAVPTETGGIALEVDGQQLEIARVRLVVRRINLKPVEDDIGHEFNAPARVVELPFDGSVVELAVSDVPPGTYDRAEIRVHRVDPDDAEDAAAIEADPEGFADFIAGERYSLIVEGTFGTESFTFKSRESDDQEMALLPPLEVTGDRATNVTLSMAPETWFLSPEGALLNPALAENEDLIDENFKQSIEAFHDDDRDGESDD
jgi:hypothetical protein